MNRLRQNANQMWGSRSYKNLYAYIKEIVFLLFGNVSASVQLWLLEYMKILKVSNRVYIFKKKKGGLEWTDVAKMRVWLVKVGLTKSGSNFISK
jgi:hypothetical protein